jgi:inosine-uridine nucleoside N-ribohydrolase
MSVVSPPRKVVIDVDPGLDAVTALAAALFDPRLEVLAVTATAGNVSAEQATRAVQAIIEQLDPPRWPRIGAAVEPERAPAENLSFLSGPDGLGGAEFRVAELHQRHPADKVLNDVVRSAPQQVTVVTLGPPTNVARCLRRDPTFAAQLGQLVISGGTYAVPGDVTPAAEFNFFFSPLSARDVLRCRATKTLVPLDAATKTIFDYGFLDRLPGDETRVGMVLRRLLPYYYRTHRQHLGLEGIMLPDVMTLLALTQPELFTTKHAAVDVETSGEITSGATVFDRRNVPKWATNVDVAIDVNSAGVLDALLTSLERAAAAE